MASAAVLDSRFLNEHAPYPSCHASTLAQTTAGTVVAAWFGGTAERNPDVGIWITRQENGKWRDAVEVANGIQPNGTPRLPTWNPVLFQAPGGGPLMLFYKVGPSPSTWWGMVTASQDDGKTWENPRRLPDNILGPIKNKPVVLKDGVWLCPTSKEGTPTGWRVYFERTRDAGKTWELVGPVAGLEGIQPSVLFLPDGTLKALCRTKSGVIGETVSRDNGKSWSPLEATNLPNPNSGTDAVTLQDGRHLLVYNNTAPPPDRPNKGVRYPIDVALSDDGTTWRHVLVLDNKPCTNGYAYPAVIQTRDGKVHITYTWDRKHIKYVVLDPARL